MKTRLAFVLALFPALTLAAAPAPRLAVAVLPPVSDPAHAELALLIQAKASAALGQSERYADFHLKQILGMAAEEGLDPATFASDQGALIAARHLGAQRVAFAKLEGKAGAWTLKAFASNPGAKKTQTRTVKLPEGFAKAVDQGGLALAGLLAKLDGADLGKNAAAASPHTASDEAARQYGRCHAVLVRQPIGIENPALLRESELTGAISACRAALAADAGFDAARAALGLALAISGEDASVVETLGQAMPNEGYEPLYWVARFWLVTRYQSNEAGVAVLRAALTRYPGLLLAHGYLGELLNVLGRQPEALVAWNDFLTLAPASPFVLARVAKTEARLGKHPEAIEKTKRALALDPESIELKMQLASRHIDAGQLGPAIEVLEPLRKTEGVRAEAVLRLGFAYLGQGDLERAEPVLRAALAAAKDPGEWRTRARANYDLALCAAKRKSAAPAQAYLLDSMREGFRPKMLDPELKALAAQGEADALKAAKPAGAQLAPKLALAPRPREASPFAIDASGDLDPGRAKPPPPQGFEILKFGN